MTIMCNRMETGFDSQDFQLGDFSVAESKEPRASAPIRDYAFNVFPPLDKAAEIAPCAQILLTSYPEDAERMLPKQRKLRGLGPDSPVTPDHDKTSTGHFGNPIRVERSHRYFRD